MPPSVSAKWKELVDKTEKWEWREEQGPRWCPWGQMRILRRRCRLCLATLNMRPRKVISFNNSDQISIDNSLLVCGAKHVGLCSKTCHLSAFVLNEALALAISDSSCHHQGQYCCHILIPSMQSLNECIKKYQNRATKDCNTLNALC